MKRLITLIVLTSVILSGCFLTDFFGNIARKMRGGKLPTKQIVLQTSKDDFPLTVEVADDPAERERGLMERDRVEEGAGMLFVFADEAPRSFWMKNTRIPLDVIFFNSQKEVVHIIENMEPCTTPECVSYPSKIPSMYALEVRGGFVEAYGVKVGDKMIES